MGDSWYDVMQVCLDGHRITDCLRSQPHHGREHCPDCGSRTISKCPKCATDIPGYYHVPGFISSSEGPKPPTHCGKCGEPFPWAKKVTRQKLSVAAQQALELFERQVEQLAALRNGDGKNPSFIRWRDTTTGLFKRFGADSPHFARYKLLKFRLVGDLRFAAGRNRPRSAEQERERFGRSCDISRECIMGIITEIEHFDLPSPSVGETPTKKDKVGVHQEFHGPVTINAQQIATEHAVQSLTQTNNKLAESFKQITTLLEESENLTRRDQREALEAIQSLSEQMQRKEHEGKSQAILQNGQKLLGIMDKAIDVGKKLAPYVAMVRGLLS